MIPQFLRFFINQVSPQPTGRPARPLFPMRSVLFILLLIILLIGNPGRTKFKEYLGYDDSGTSKPYKTAMRRTQNFLLFSIYTHEEAGKDVYLGILWNFFRVG